MEQGEARARPSVDPVLCWVGSQRAVRGPGLGLGPGSTKAAGSAGLREPAGKLGGWVCTLAGIDFIADCPLAGPMVLCQSLSQSTSPLVTTFWSLLSFLDEVPFQC